MPGLACTGIPYYMIVRRKDVLFIPSYQISDLDILKLVV